MARWLAPAPVSGWRDLPPSVTATTGTAPDGHRVHVVHNWNWGPVSVTVPAPLSDAISGGPVSEVLDLGPWDVRVLVSAS